MTDNNQKINWLDYGEPTYHDYVVASEPLWSLDQNMFFLSNIGQIQSISDVNGKPLYTVYYDKEIRDMPNFKLGKDRNIFWRKDIKHWSKNKEDLLQFVELYDDISKYNL